MAMKLTKQEIANLDPYQFMAALGKKVIHPGGKQSTREVYAMARLQPNQTVLEIGCGLGTTGIEIVKRFGCNVIITDIDEKMIEKAARNVDRTRLHDKMEIQKADIQQLPFAVNSFDVLIIEAVTMFVNRQKAIKEVFRVCKPNGKVIEHEFIWRKTPSAKLEKYLKGKTVRE